MQDDISFFIHDKQKYSCISKLPQIRAIVLVHYRSKFKSKLILTVCNSVRALLRSVLPTNILVSSFLTLSPPDPRSTKKQKESLFPATLSIKIY